MEALLQESAPSQSLSSTPIDAFAIFYGLLATLVYFLALRVEAHFGRDRVYFGGDLPESVEGHSRVLALAEGHFFLDFFLPPSLPVFLLEHVGL